MRKQKGRGSDLRRMSFVIFLTLVFWCVLIIRLIQIQLFNKGKYTVMAKNQYLQEVKLETPRGSIFDRNLQCLALNEPTLSIGVDLNKVEDLGLVAKKLSALLKEDENILYRTLISGRQFAWLARDIDKVLADLIEALNIPGVHLLNEAKRIYPYKSVAAAVLGFTDIDERGLSGIEHEYDRQLRGKPGKKVIQKDARGHRIPDVGYPVEPPRPGKNFVTSINYVFQSIVEEELRYSIKQFGADGGIVVVLNPQNGEVLAMASEPGFDSNKARKYSPERWRNRAITDVFEPGSTFKSVITSAVLEEGIRKIDDIIDCGNGSYQVLDKSIRDHQAYHKLTVGDVLVKSSNVGMVKITQRTDPKLVYKYARNFGFGIPTGIELGGEISGELKNPVDWSDFTPAAIAMGYEVAVTPLQLSMAYAAIANGGRLLRPKIILDATEKPPRKPESSEPKTIRRVLSKKTAETMRQLLEQVVQRGTGTKARIDGVRICGKTGTAHKYKAKSHGYSEDEFLASFVGFFPADDPQLLVCTMIDNPRTTYWGGEVAAPTFKRIAQRLISVDNHLAGKPAEQLLAESSAEDQRQETTRSKLPDFRNMRLSEAKTLLHTLGMSARHFTIVAN